MLARTRRYGHVRCTSAYPPTTDFRREISASPLRADLPSGTLFRLVMTRLGHSVGKMVCRMGTEREGIAFLVYEPSFVDSVQIRRMRYDFVKSSNNAFRPLAWRVQNRGEAPSQRVSNSMIGPRKGWRLSTLSANRRVHPPGRT